MKCSAPLQTPGKPSLRPTTLYLLIVLGLISIVVVLLVDREDGSPTHEDEPTPRVVAVDSSRVLSLPRSDPGRLVLSGSVDLSGRPFVTAVPGRGAREGFLLKVLTSQSTGRRTVATVRPASLFEAVPSGELAVDPGDFEPAGIVYEKFEELEDVQALARFSIAAAKGEDDEPSLAPFELRLPCREQEGSYLDLKLERSLKPRVDMRWNRPRRRRTQIESATVGLAGEASATVMAESVAKLHCKYEPKPLKIPALVAAIPVGPVVVPITASPLVKFAGAVTVAAKASASARAAVAGFASFEYHNGSLEALAGGSREIALTGPALEARLRAEASVGPGVEIKAGWGVPYLGKLALSAGIHTPVGISIEHKIAPSPLSRACFSLAAKGELAFHLPFGKSFKKGATLAEVKKCKPPKRSSLD